MSPRRSAPKSQLRARPVRRSTESGPDRPSRTGDDRLAAAVELFNDRRGDIEAAFPAEGSLRHGNKRAQKYIAEFFEVINDPAATQEEILDICRGTPDSWE